MVWLAEMLLPETSILDRDFLRRKTLAFFAT
jgi:hypothetical protein